MKTWPVGFMGQGDVVALVSFVEERGYWTESEEVAIRAMARVGMPPWIVAQKVRRWIVDQADVTTLAMIAVRRWVDEHPEPAPAESMAERMQRMYQQYSWSSEMPYWARRDGEMPYFNASSGTFRFPRGKYGPA